MVRRLLVKAGRSVKKLLLEAGERGTYVLAIICGNLEARIGI